MPQQCSPIVPEAERVADGVLLLNERRPSAVLEVVEVVLAHEAVPDAAKVDPDVGHLMDEERPGVEKLDVVDRLPFVRRAPGLVTLAGRSDGSASRARARRGSAPRRSLPSDTAESRSPDASHGKAWRRRRASSPSRRARRELRELADLGFVRGVAVEVLGRGERTGDQQRGVDARQLAMPIAPARCKSRKW